MNMKWWFIVLLLVIGVTAIIAGMISLIGARSTPPVSQPVVIKSILLGGLRSVSDATKPNPRIVQKDSYDAGEPLAIRIVTSQQLTQAVTFSVRLLTENGTVQALQPPQLTIQPGTTSFCCWQISQPGNYRLQIFKPDNTITTIPITITKSSTPPGSSGGFLHFF